jgi:hypothetical protein
MLNQREQPLQIVRSDFGRSASLGFGQQALSASLVERMNATSHGISAIEHDLGNLRHTHSLGRQQQNLTMCFDRCIRGLMIEVLQHLSLFCRQVLNVDFCWSAHEWTSLFEFFVFHCTRFPARVSPGYLDTYQLLYIQTVYSYFQENLQWPTYRQVQKKILPIHRNFRALNVAKSIEGNTARYFHQTLENHAILSLQEIRQLPESEQDLADLMKAIRYSVEKYIIEDKEEVRVFSEEMKQHFSFDEATVWKIHQLLGLNTGITNGGSSSPAEKTWDFKISDDAVDYQDLVSIDDFLQRREEILKGLCCKNKTHQI